MSGTSRGDSLGDDFRSDGRKRSFLIDWVGLFVFVSVWLRTFNQAYVNGDDVVHLGQKYGIPAFLPHFSNGWIPNRAMDSYGRNLLGRVFDAMFFPLKDIFGIDFFHFYKFFCATLFAIFVFCVYRYIIRLLGRNAIYKKEGMSITSGNTVLVHGSIAIFIMIVLQWFNQVFWICYQMPSFLGFVIMAEIWMRSPATSSVECGREFHPLFFALVFLVSFSLEAYSAIILVFVFFTIINNWNFKKRFTHLKEYFLVLQVLAALSLVALVIVQLFSQRASLTAKESVAGQFILLIESPHSVSIENRLYFLAIAYSFISSALLVLIVYKKGKSAYNIADVESHIPTKIKRLEFRKNFLIFLFGTVNSSIGIVALVSLRAGQNYFSFLVYPWAGFLLISAFSAIWFFAEILIAWPDGISQRLLRNVFLMVLVSSGLISSIGNAPQKYRDSQMIYRAYDAAEKSSGGVFVSGLDVETIPMEHRPLPTENSPDWFLDDYKSFFNKYYGHDSNVRFK